MARFMTLAIISMFKLHSCFVSCFIGTKRIITVSVSSSNRHISTHLHSARNEDDRDKFIPDNMDEIPLSQIFQRAMVLQRSGVDREGALKAYEEFLTVAKLHDVDPFLYAEVHANIGAIYAMQGKDESKGKETKREMRQKAKLSFQKAVEYRPGLGSAWVNLALLMLAEGKEMSGEDIFGVENVLKEARSCCVRAMGIDNDDERSRQLANKLIGDIDTMMKQNNNQKPFQ